MTVAYNQSTGEGMYLGQDNTWQKAKVAKAKDGRIAIYNGSEWEPTKSNIEPDISLTSGIVDTAETAGKSALAIPAYAYSAVRHPIDTATTMIGGIKDIPQNIANKSADVMKSVGTDINQAIANPDPWQKFLRGGRAALGVASSPLSVFVGAPVESTYGKVVSNQTGGFISPEEAAFIPEGAVGAKAVPKGVKDTAGAVKGGLAQAGKEIKPNVIKTTPPGVKAADVIAKRFEQGQKAGGPSLKEAIEQVKKARAAGKPMTLADVGQESVKGLAGYVARAPGESRDISRKFLQDRDAASAMRLTDDVEKYIANGSVRQTAEALANARSLESKPLFEEAFRGGSMAPLARQFQNSFESATKESFEAAADVMKHMKTIERLNAELKKSEGKYTNVGVHEELLRTKSLLSQAEMRLTQAQSDRSLSLEALRGAEKDKTMNAPGAVWNPRIQRLMANPNLRKGLSKGIRIERNLADAEGRPFNPHEYAITGFDKDGEPIVGKVPNMRLLASAKEGLDDMLGQDGMRDPLTGRLTKEGRSIDMLRRAVLKELDDANPKYKAARDKWAGHSRSMEALKYGRDIFKGKPEDIAAEVADMSKAEKDFMKLGAADMIRERILKTGFNGDEAKAIIKSPWAQEQLRPLFDSDTQFRSFVDAVTNERTMFESKNKIVGNSQTAERVAEDSGGDLALAAKAGKGGMQLFSGQFSGALNTLIDLKRNWALRNNPELNGAIAKMLFDPNVDFDSFGLAPEKP